MRFQWQLKTPHLLVALLAGVVFLPFLFFGDDEPLHLERVLERGELVLLTRNGASSYYTGPQGETGPEYELVRAFADELGVDVRVEVADSIGSLIDRLAAGEGDLVASGLTPTPDRAERLRFGLPTAETRILVVARRGITLPDSLAELVDLDVSLIADSIYEDLLEEARAEHPGLSWSLRGDNSVAELLQALGDGEFDATLVDENIFYLNRAFYPRVRVAFDLGVTLPQAWAYARNDDSSLRERADAFIAEARDNGLLADIQARFTIPEAADDPVGMHQFMADTRSRLPALLPIFEEVANAHDLDWRLLAALAYQESKWDPLATSHTGVRGIMQLTRRTASALGVADRLDPEQSIEGGARYFKRQWRKIPERIPEPDRTWMALAAYNIGYGHLEDARVLTQKGGGDPDAWHDVARFLPRLSQEQWYTQTRHGYARGYEASEHVRRIRRYYDILRWMDTRAHPLLVAEKKRYGSTDVASRR